MTDDDAEQLAKVLLDAGLATNRRLEVTPEEAINFGLGVAVAQLSSLGRTHLIDLMLEHEHARPALCGFMPRSGWYDVAAVYGKVPANCERCIARYQRKETL